METKSELKDQAKIKKCEKSSCRSCSNCRTIVVEEKAEIKSPLQLYAKEAEGYFFYYALQEK